jgi:hypothetical protein
MPHGRLDAEAPSINLGAATNGGAFPGTNPSMFTDIGETMAQTYVRVLGDSVLSPDIRFTDVWSNPETTTLAAEIQFNYADLATPLPVTQSCAQTWTSLCRTTINYPEHIQPIFERLRQTLDVDGMVVNDNTCIACHSPADEDGLARVPAGQLDLSSSASLDDPDTLTSYRELMFNDNALEVVEGVLVDIMEPVFDGNGDPVFLVDEDGELILDAEGNPIQLTRPIRVNASMNPNGARASARFFAPFTGANATHQDFLAPVERKLIAEWLDIGGQYYNNPFAVPQN